MIDPFQVATQGLGPGWTTFNAATMGFGFVVEVEVKPVPEQPSGGGGAGWIRMPEEWRAKRRLVTITVRHGKKTIWTIERIVELERAEIIVDVVNFINKVNNSIQITVENIRTSAPMRITANAFSQVGKRISVTVNEVKKQVTSKFKKDK